MKSPDLSIIIVSFNTRDITENCLKSVLKSLENSKLGYEVIVIDNDSQDGSVDMIRGLQEKYPQIKLVENKINAGFGKANDQGVKRATSEYVLLLNSDTVVLDDAVEKLLTFFKENEKNIHFLGGKLLNQDMSPQASCGPFYSLPVIFGALFLRGDYWNLTRYSPDKLKKVDWISGACILTKKEFFTKLKGFDEGIFMYMEEIDLLYRARKHGFNVYFYPEARFIHLGSASSGGRTYPILQVYTGFLYLYRKHRSKLHQILLKIMLKLKALVSIGIGRLTGNSYLTETYEKALKLTQETR